MIDKKIKTIAEEIWSLEQKCQKEYLPEYEQKITELMTGMDPQDLLNMIFYMEENFS